MNQLSKNLRHLIDCAKLSENELARRTGIPQQMINRILTGKNKNPKIATLLPLTKYFMITISDLLGDAIQNHEPSLSTEHFGWQQVPLLIWEDICKHIYGKNKILTPKETVATDAPVSSKAFAVRMPNDSMELKFEKGALLIFDPEKLPNDRDFILLDNTTKSFNKLLFRQYLVKNENPHVKCLNPKLTCYKMIPLNKDLKCVAVLVQSRLDYFHK